MARSPHRDEWRTPAEAADYRTTPDYAETLRFLERLKAAHPGWIRIEKFGETGEGRDLLLVIASKDGTFEPEAIHGSGRAILLVQNAIHAGEMDGKDACLALLRDLAMEPGARALLDRVVLAFIPVYNVDGHERRSPYTRINQKGPELAGWRANATNLNLNRDYLKAEAPETRAFLRLFERWRPDFFVDDHVTDGSDFQYDVTFILDATPNVFAPTAAWIREVVRPELERGVNAAGHLAFPAAVFLKDDTDPSRGLTFNENPPRFSTGQMIVRNRPGLLVELHMLKDYRTRVTGNYALLRTLLTLLNRDVDRLLELNRSADRWAAELGSGPGPRPPYPIALAGSGSTTPVAFRGFAYIRSTSDVSGGPRVEYRAEPWNVELPVEGARVSAAIVPPVGYIVPGAWTRVLDVLAAHGVIVERTSEAWTGPVEVYGLHGMRWGAAPFEGHHPILRGGPVDADAGRFGECVLRSETRSFPRGSAVVPLDQRLSQVAIHWLEPEAPDSAVRWGYFDAIFETKEHGEAYVVERIAREALARDPALSEEFARRLRADPAFAASPAARLEFFFERSPWGLENRVGDYPVGRLLSLDGLPIGHQPRTPA